MNVEALAVVPATAPIRDSQSEIRNSGRLPFCLPATIAEFIRVRDNIWARVKTQIQAGASVKRLLPLQIVLFVYALVTVLALCTLGRDDRWEFWVVLPAPNAITFFLFWTAFRKLGARKGIPA